MNLSILAVRRGYGERYDVVPIDRCSRRFTVLDGLGIWQVSRTREHARSKCKYRCPLLANLKILFGRGVIQEHSGEYRGSPVGRAPDLQPSAPNGVRTSPATRWCLTNDAA